MATVTKVRVAPMITYCSVTYHLTIDCNLYSVTYHMGQIMRRILRATHAVYIIWWRYRASVISYWSAHIRHWCESFSFPPFSSSIL